jgi:hypothetical protein
VDSTAIYEDLKTHNNLNLAPGQKFILWPRKIIRLTCGVKKSSQEQKWHRTTNLPLEVTNGERERLVGKEKAVK